MSCTVWALPRRNVTVSPALFWVQGRPLLGTVATPSSSSEIHLWALVSPTATLLCHVPSGGWRGPGLHLLGHRQLSDHTSDGRSRWP